jgi:sialate O-acetylesterase
MAVIVDVGEANNIHPLNKQDVGKRLALIALAKTYNKKLVYSGPVYDSMNIKGNKVILSFKDVAAGLVKKGQRLEEFTICGSDFKFVTAKAFIIDPTRVEVYSELIEKPVAVRYGWRRCPIKCNLYNSAGLPASPFRTDNQAYLSEKNK